MCCNDGGGGGRVVLGDGGGWMFDWLCSLERERESEMKKKREL